MAFAKHILVAFDFSARAEVALKSASALAEQFGAKGPEVAEGDMTFESEGVTLISDQMSFMYLMGTTIDYVEGLQGAGFKFENPNTTGSCGCGSSFSV